MSELEVVLLVFSMEGLLFIVLGYAMPGMQPSKLMGIRIPATFADERVWRDTHARSGPRFTRLGVVILVSGLVLVVAPGWDVVRLALLGAISVGGMVWFIWDSVRYANARLAHYRRQDEGGRRGG